MKRALKIEVPVEEVAQRFVQAYKELNRQVRVPGFRPGKAPASAARAALCQSRRRGCRSKSRPGLLRPRRSSSGYLAGLG